MLGERSGVECGLVNVLGVEVWPTRGTLHPQCSQKQTGVGQQTAWRCAGHLICSLSLFHPHLRATASCALREMPLSC